MSRGTNQKLKLYYLMQIMLEKTDETHYLNLAEITKYLEEKDVTAERKSLYSDLAGLADLGVKIEGVKKNNSYYYHVVARQFELAELKLLVDAIQSSKFITLQKSRTLIKKVESLASQHEASMLQRQVYVQGRIKTMNESIYTSVDNLHIAIETNKQIKFKYKRWNTKKELEYRRDGAFYVVSPWALTWDDENYYLVAYDNDRQEIRHFRVDKMDNIHVLEDVREGRKEFDRFDLAAYAKKNFGMYGGREERVNVRIDNDKVGIFIDRFGQDISVVKDDDSHVFVRFNAAISGQFFGWIFGLGEGVEILGPESVVNDAKEMCTQLNKIYNRKSKEC